MEMYFRLKLLEEIIGYILVFLVLGFWVILIIFYAIKDKIREIKERKDKEDEGNKRR